MVHPKIERILSGIQAGMLGGIVMVAVLSVLPYFELRSWFTYLNVLGAVFYGPRALSAGPGWITIAGAALQLCIAGAGGALFAVIAMNVSGKFRVAFLGLFWSIVIFFVSEQVYRAKAPIVSAYLPPVAALFAHLWYGAFLTGVRRKHGNALEWAPAAAIATSQSGADQTALPEASATVGEVRVATDDKASTEAPVERPQAAVFEPLSGPSDRPPVNEPASTTETRMFPVE